VKTGLKLIGVMGFSFVTSSPMTSVTGKEEKLDFNQFMS
jgi:hypothetical protein